MILKQIILDIETTGLYVKDGERIIEICCREILNRKIKKKIFHTYINVDKIVTPGAYSIHGINNNFLKDKPIFKDIVDKFLDFIYNSEIIIHNSKFDVSFLDNELSIIGYKKFNYYCKKITDTLIIARNIFPGKRNNLNSLCQRFGIDFKKRKFHSAFLDTKLLAKVFLFMTRKENVLIFRKKKYHKNNSLVYYNCNNIIKANADELKEHYFFLKKIKNYN